MQHTQKQGKDTQNGSERNHNGSGNVHVPDSCTADVRTDPLTRLKEAAHHMRWNAGLDDYPYEGDIETLKTSLICTLNILSDLISYIEERSNEP